MMTNIIFWMTTVLFFYKFGMYEVLLLCDLV